ncbi:NADH-quinone oxidoreductase subunit F [Nocardioides sp. GY 10113]|uniref:NADH-ubiquinone oxidoreductase-F iron-sulfur binding region domain-containing protein n=1 Tax=Nocardioides sp. GY 10113 TaxID=2569761 RepID=UPI0010A933BB|nr:NADH-ubiquinone oxidoreductase-F iron-sulfur binding region domain-containing protein [Nocardioides sp. GY 10113]TIC80441.1 NADH-quinone oxidoreductase subunit F [Nocardioides sp. GY 10113]
MSAPLSPVPIPTHIGLHAGPALLSGITDGPSLEAHRERYGPLPPLELDDLVDLASRAGLRGRGGAGFPFATKLAAAARGRRRELVVNLSEGEPASAKDSALALSRPHLVLDGAVATARALGAREVHVVLPGDRPAPARQMLRALGERDRREDRVRLRPLTAEPRFVAGQARAVVELMSGRPNLPVTSWAPEAVAGFRGRPTLISNAETWAQVGQLLLAGERAYVRRGTPGEPGTTLLTHSRHGVAPEVWEVDHGTPVGDVLPPLTPETPVLVGGFHGAWTTWSTLARTGVSRLAMAAEGLPLGAGVIHVPAPGGCPLGFTSAVVDYLAGQSAGRCGPCLNGLPALAEAVRGAWQGRDTTARVDQLAGLLVRRGACAHPDGTVRLVRSVFTALPAEVDAHRRGSCSAATTGAGAAS